MYQNTQIATRRRRVLAVTFDMLFLIMTLALTMYIYLQRLVSLLNTTDRAAYYAGDMNVLLNAYDQISTTEVYVMRFIIVLISLIFFLFIPLITKGRTIGKMICKLKVVKAESEEPVDYIDILKKQAFYILIMIVSAFYELFYINAIINTSLIVLVLFQVQLITLALDHDNKQTVWDRTMNVTVLQY